MFQHQDNIRVKRERVLREPFFSRTLRLHKFNRRAMRAVLQESIKSKTLTDVKSIGC